jgi:hypothetical protein
MSKESKKFPAVMTIKDVLGLPEGTVLRFDWASGKYVSISEEEDIADDYYYSGYAVAIDPYVVKDNVGSLFTFIEQVNEPEVEEPKEEVKVAEKVEEPKKSKKTKKESKVEVEEKVVYSDEDALDQLKTEEELKAEGRDPDTIDGFPKYDNFNPLVVDCGCGHRSLLQVVQAPGINITLMANDDNSFVELHCKECGAGLKLWFAPENEVTNESIKEESN